MMNLAARLFAVGTLAMLVFAGGHAHAQEEEPYGMVSLRITVQKYDQAEPWHKSPERVVRGNALVLKDGLLLTTADLVKNATLIEARKFGRYPNYSASLHLVDYELDLALLRVNSDEFWRGLKPLPIADKPVTSGRFAINRWRSNGRFEQGSGEVVQLQVATSRFGNLEYPELQGTTTMSALGWGEILTSEGKVIGIISSHDRSTISAVNSPMLKRFIIAAQQQPYPGFAHRGFYWQQLNHEAMREFYGLNGGETGVLIRRLLGGGTGAKQLRKGDILLQLGPYEIDPEGRITHPYYGPILFTIAINETLEPTIPAVVIRSGKRMRLNLTRRPFAKDDFRVRPYVFDRQIDYEMFGGLVLQELSLGYLRLWGKEWRVKAPTRLVIEYFLNSLRQASEKKEKVVIVSKVLPDSANIGYGDVNNSILVRANGKPVRSLDEFRSAIRTPEGGYHVLEFNPTKGRGKIIFTASEMEAANRRVRQRYGVLDARPKLTTAKRGN